MKALCHFLLMSLLLVPVTVYAESAGDAALRQGSVKISGYDLHYNISGQGPVKIIFLHGLFADKSHWTALAGWMDKNDYTCIAPDLPCYGGSAAYPVQFAALDMQVETLHGFIQTLSLKKVHLMGSSLGGMVALAYGRRYPDETASICLVGAPAGLFPWSDELMKKFNAGANPFIPQNRDEFRFEMKCLFAAPPSIPDDHADRAVAAYRNNMARYTSLFSIVSVSMYNFSTTPAAGYKCPVLMILGKNESVFAIRDLGTIMKVKIPAGEYTLVPDAGHLPMIERPGPIADRYKKFLAGTNKGK